MPNISIGKVCTPFDPKQVEKFDITNVPTLSTVVNDIAHLKENGGRIPCLEPCFNVFRNFLKKCKVEAIEEIRQNRAINGKLYSL